MGDQTNKRLSFPTITQSFLHQVRSHPNRVNFFTKEGTAWRGQSWQEYYDAVKQISLGLMELGVKPGDRVCLVSNTRIEWAECDMAILGAKGITVPVYASNTAEESAYIIHHCEAEVVFVEDAKQLEKIASIRAKIPLVKKIIPFTMVGSVETAKASDVLSLAALRELGRRAPEQGRFDHNLLTIQPSDVFTICYTSGTTGVPKGVVLVYESLTSILEDVAQQIGRDAGSNDKILSFLPISHIFGKVESMAAYHFGWQVYYAESVEKVLLNLAEVGPTLLFAVPRVFEKAYARIKAMVDEGSPAKQKAFAWAMEIGKRYYGAIWEGKRPSVVDRISYELAYRVVFKKIYQRFGGHLRFCIAGGAPLPREIGEFMCIVGIPILEGYGLTETCAPVTINTPEKIKFGSIGRPLPEVSLKIADDGEILVRSKKVFLEYYKNPEATREVKTHDGWFHTGDIGVIDPDGYVRITDRKKDLIVTSGGKNVAPQKIENMAKTYRYISQFVVHGDKRNYLTALVVLEKESVVKFAKENNILFSEYPELLRHAKVQGIVQNVIEDINRKLASFETIKRFTILPADFSVESGELTPSLKVRRKFCSEKYRAELDGMYNANA